MAPDHSNQAGVQEKCILQILISSIKYCGNKPNQNSFRFLLIKEVTVGELCQFLLTRLFLLSIAFA